MKSYRQLGLVIIYVLLGSSLDLFSQEVNVEGKTVTSIEFEGLKRHNPQEILSKIQTKINTPFSYGTFREDIQKLVNTGFFAPDIRWDFEISGEGVKIIIRVSENEMVENIHLVGVKSLDIKTISDTLKLKINGPFKKFYLDSDLRLIKEQYREKGYYFAEVVAKQSQGLRGVIVIYQVREGPRVTVRNLKITGNNAFQEQRQFLFFSSHPLIDRMTTKPRYWSWFSYATVPYDEVVLLNDLTAITTFYQQEGWFDVRAFITDVSFTEDKTEVDIAIRIVEGKRYIIRKLEVRGNRQIESSKLLANVKIKSGMPYRTIDAAKALQAIKREYGKLGLIDCDIEPLTPSSEEGVVDLIFNIKEGEPKYLESVQISGNYKTKDKVIRRSLLIYPGDLMDYEKVETSRERIMSTRFFQSVDFDIDEGLKKDTKDLMIKVEETTTGRFYLTGGFSSNQGFGGGFGITQNNFDIGRLPKSFGEFFSGNSFAGGGQKLSLEYQPGTLLSRFVVSFTEPYLFDKPIQLGLDYSGWERNWTDYDEERESKGVSLSRRFKSGWEIGLGSRVQRIDISKIESTAPDIIKELSGNNRLNSLRPSLGLDKRDSWLYTTSGYRFDLDFIYTGGFLSGDFDFIKTIFRGEYYRPLIPDQKKLVLNLIGKFGRLNKFDDTTTIPFFEKFYAGGTDTVRGFEYRTISPKKNDVSIGGDVTGVFNLEVTYPLYSYENELIERPMDIARFVVFFDAGDVVDKVSDLKLSDFRTSLGFGFRFYLGPMPLSLYAGWPIKMQDDDERETIQIDIGFMY